MNKNKKENIIVFLFCFLISVCTYIFFVSGYNSLDTHRIFLSGYLGYAINTSLADGRVLMGIIGIIFDKINCSYIIFYQIQLILALIVSSISVAKIYKIVNKKIENSLNRVEKIFVFLLSYTCIFNFMYIDAMQFAECFVISLSILLYILSAENIVIKNKKIFGILMAIFGMICYQGTLSFFLGISLLFIMITDDEKKKKIKNMGYCLLAIILAGIIDILFVKLYGIFGISTTERFSGKLLETFLQNMKYIPNIIIENMGLFPKYSYLILIILFVITMYIYLIKNNKYKEFIKLIGMLCSTLLFAFSIMAIEYGVANYDGRIYIFLASILNVVCIYAITNNKIEIDKSKIMKNILMFLIGIYFILNILNTFYVTYMYKQANILDETISKEIVMKLKENSNADRIAILYNYQNSNLNKYNEYICAKSNYLIGTFNSMTIKYYTGNDVKQESIDEVQRKEILKNMTDNSERSYIEKDGILYVKINI